MLQSETAFSTVRRGYFRIRLGLERPEEIGYAFQHISHPGNNKAAEHRHASPEGPRGTQGETGAQERLLAASWRAPSPREEVPRALEERRRRADGSRTMVRTGDQRLMNLRETGPAARR